MCVSDGGGDGIQQCRSPSGGLRRNAGAPPAGARLRVSAASCPGITTTASRMLLTSVDYSKWAGQGILDLGVIRPRTADEPSNEDLPSCSRDGHWFYFQSTDSQSSIPIDLVAPSVIKNQQIEKGVSRYPGARYSTGPLRP